MSLRPSRSSNLPHAADLRFLGRAALLIALVCGCSAIFFILGAQERQIAERARSAFSFAGTYASPIDPESLAFHARRKLAHSTVTVMHEGRAAVDPAVPAFPSLEPRTALEAIMAASRDDAPEAMRDGFLSFSGAPALPMPHPLDLRQSPR